MPIPDNASTVKTETQPIPPITVTMIGTGDGAGTPMVNGTVAVTHDHFPDIVIRVISPIIAITVRFINVYIGVLVGTLIGAMGSGVITAPDFYHLFLKCASLSVCGPVILLLKDVGTVMLGLEKKFPLATGSV